MASLDGSICRCGRTAAPPRRYCPDCQRSMVPTSLEAKGVVVTFTTEEVTPHGFEAPVHLAVVKVPGGGKGKTPIRVLARMEKPASPQQAVRLEARGEALWAVPG